MEKSKVITKADEQAQPIIAENVPFKAFLVTYEGQRVEWHAGKVVKQVTNNTTHNLIQGFLYLLLNFYLEFTVSGKVLLAGIPMYISDDQPAREPDLMVVLNANLERLKAQYLDGPADLVVEIVSPGTGHVDRGAKFEEYERAGVGEYWLIDPLREDVWVYHLGEKGHYQRIEPDANKRLASIVLPGFVLDPAVFWQEELPSGMAIVEMAQAMVAE